MEKDFLITLASSVRLTRDMHIRLESLKEMIRIHVGDKEDVELKDRTPRWVEKLTNEIDML